MARRVKRTSKKKTPQKKVKKRATQAKKSKPAAKKSIAVNKKAHWAAYKELQARVDRAWARLRSNVLRKASPKTLIKDKNELLLLLGECNYMARECMNITRPKKGR